MNAQAAAQLAFVYSVWAIAGSGADIIARDFMVLLLGIPAYIGVKCWQARQAIAASAQFAGPIGPALELESTFPSCRFRLVPS